jgi:hypothetical protein
METFWNSDRKDLYGFPSSPAELSPPQLSEHILDFFVSGAADEFRDSFRGGQ